MSVSKIVAIKKSLTDSVLFRVHPEIKRMPCDGNFWASGYYANTVSQYANKYVIMKYIANQGQPTGYKKIYSEQLNLF